MRECECGNGKVIERKRYCACEDDPHEVGLSTVDPVTVVKKSPRSSERR